MVGEKAVKAVSLALITILIVLGILLALGKIEAITFWVGIAVIAFMAYQVIPRIKKKN
ncbi:hypothetical protein J4453_01585 [Candidatus Woesearchaeota archaeon]|nr:hypothetical protein [Candidatus Woesearchaeota archaeon]